MAFVLSGDAATNRTNLGLGTAATLDVGSGASQIVQRDGSGKIDAAGLTGTLPAIDGSNLTNVDAGALTLVGTTTISSAVSTVVVDTSNFDNSYAYHRVIFEFQYPSPTSSGNGWMSFSNTNNSTAAGAAGSHWHYFSHAGWVANYVATGGGRDTTDIQMDADGSRATTQVWEVDIWGMNKAKEKVVLYRSVGRNHDAGHNINGLTGMGTFAYTSSSNCALIFSSTSASFTGTIKVYGVAA